MSLPARYARAVAYFRGSDLEQSRRELQSLISEDPRNPYYQELMGQILFENGRAEEALAEMQKALARELEWVRSSPRARQAKSKARLSAYEQMAAAEASNEIRVVDREQVRNTRRTLFGLTLPDLNVFGSGEDDPMNEVNGTIRSVTELADGKWAFTLEDGARWVQIDNRQLSSFPRPGHTVRIRRAAMGSFLANIQRNTAIRVRRSN